ncbi:hypothetical protein J3S90_05015 [Flavobacterium sp. P4023]|uniref:Lipoprotein n=1 Tax=Flavobacterium flabelliforme TaxID=2816119 RepID=A0ABS5CR99_9FLAO|nr:hypothetical protein [Flavobacterium flabelliforme]MBP4141159.1 hypothetical protein [Flavobacterium flabelliforme]
MKNKIFCLFGSLFLICSCSSFKKVQSPITAYLLTKTNKNDTIMVIEEMINNNFTIDFLQAQSKIGVNKNTIDDSTPHEDIYNEKDWLIMQKKYQNKTKTANWLNNDLWHQKDFNKLNIKLIKEDLFPKPWVINEYLKEENKEIKVFAFSKPIFYKNNRFILFAKSETTTKKQFITPNSIVIMQKRNGVWIIKQELISNIYY